MSNEVIETKLSNEDASALAHEWIEHLKKKGKTRLIFIVCLLLVLVAAAAVIVSMEFDKRAINAQLLDSASRINGLEVSLEAKVVEIDELNQAFSKSEQSREFLEQVKGDTASQLNVAEQIIQTQKEKIALVEGEIERSSELAMSLESQLGGVQKGLASEKASLKKLNTELSKRSSAYKALVKRQGDMRDEMDRLADALDQSTAEKSSAQKQLNTVKSELKQARNRLLALNKELAEVNSKLAAKDVPVIDLPVEVVKTDHRSLAIQPILSQPAKDESPESDPNVVDPNALMIQ